MEYCYKNIFLSFGNAQIHQYRDVYNIVNAGNKKLSEMITI